MSRAARRKKAPPKPSARPPTRPDMVPNPYGRGVDAIERVVDSLDHMHRRGFIDERQLEAATRYRAAFEDVRSGLACVLGSEPVAAQAGPRSPMPRNLLAADLLRQASTVLGELDTRVLNEIAVGESIANIAGKLFGRASQRQIDHVGQRVRLALDALADLWIPERRGRCRASVHREPDARPAEFHLGEIAHKALRGVVVHAAPHKASQAQRKQAYAAR